MNIHENTKSIVTSTQVWVASFIGGPLAGCYLAGYNFKTMGDSKGARQWYLSGIIATVILMLAFFFLPEWILHKIPNTLVPIMYVSVIYTIFIQLQGKYIKEQLNIGNKKYSWWKVFAISILAMLSIVVFGCIMGICFIKPT